MSHSIVTRKPRPPKQERIDKIADSARRVFCEHGFEKASIVEIAGLADIAEGTIYRYFDGKRGLLHEVLRRHYQIIFDDIQQTLPGVHDAGNRLRYLIRRVLLAIASDRGMCGLITREIRQDTPEHHSIARDLNRHFASLLVDVVREGIADGSFREDTSVSTVRDLIGGGLELIAWSYMVTGNEIDVERVTENVARTVIGGIEVRAEESMDVDVLVSRLERVATKLESTD